MFHRALLAVACSMLLAAAAQAAEVYKMVDKSGRVHYSDQPQPGWTRVDVAPALSPGASAPLATPDEQAQRDAECKSKKELLARYKGASVIKETDGLGRERVYSPEERQQLIDRTQKQADDACAGSSG